LTLELALFKIQVQVQVQVQIPSVRRSPLTKAGWTVKSKSKIQSKSKGL